MFRIETLNRATGRFTGHGTQTYPQYASLTFTGTVRRSQTVAMRIADSTLHNIATARGKVRQNGIITGTFTDSEGNKGRWTMVPLPALGC